MIKLMCLSLKCRAYGVNWWLLKLLHAYDRLLLQLVKYTSQTYLVHLGLVQKQVY